MIKEIFQKIAFLNNLSIKRDQRNLNNDSLKSILKDYQLIKTFEAQGRKTSLGIGIENSKEEVRKNK